MAASNFLGTKAEHDDWHRLEAIEHRHIDLAPKANEKKFGRFFS